MYRIVSCALLLTVLAACAPSVSTPTAAPAKPTESSAKPAGSPAAAGSPSANPAASPSASPAASGAATTAPKPVAKLPDFPTKPIEIVVPYPPGGGFDAVARQLANPMSRELGQPVVIKNVPGGNQRIGARQFEQAPADGHTLMYVSDTPLYTSTLVDPPEGFDITSWQWVVGVRKFAPFVATGRDSRFKSMQDVIDADRAGQRIRMGHNGIGGYLPLLVVFTETVGLKNVAYVGGFGGTGDIAPAMVRGDIDLMVYQPISSTIQFVKSGDIRSLAVLTATRDPLLPDTPTGRELNLPNVDELEALAGQTVGFAVAKGTNADRIKVLEQATLNALQDPDFRKWAAEAGVDHDLVALTAQEMTQNKVTEYELFRSNAEPLRRAAQGS